MKCSDEMTAPSMLSLRILGITFWSVTFQKRNRRYHFDPYLALFRSPDSISEDSNSETTPV